MILFATWSYLIKSILDEYSKQELVKDDVCSKCYTGIVKLANAQRKRGKF